ncbi:MAG: zinc ribbon domain-containing protein [Gammaproteobacteria bacterium]|nr:zinc ribbon domain-containing protein [Gammaproteobacteria bacterium]
MPLYEYRCDACEHEFEALQKMSDEPLVHCPACDEATLKKLVSAADFRLKGDGWYETDFKSGTKRNLAESDSSAKKTKAAGCGTSCGCH